VLHVSTFAQEKTVKKVDTTISWKPTIKLNWSDFQGKVNPNTFGKAKTSYKIEIIPENVKVDGKDRIHGYKSLTTEARFYKRQSWTTISANDTIVLSHERLHFDIAELFARKIRKEFIKLQNNKEARFSAYSQAYSLFWKACRQYQKQFDLETNHGRELDLNIAWSHKVKLAIESLSEYK
jgi:hypothetical protein